MRRCWISAVLLLLSLPVAEAGAIQIPLTLDAGTSFVVPDVGASQALSGSLLLELGTLPVLGNTPFDLIGVSLALEGGASIGLDPAVANPGLGVLNAAGAFLIPTLFARLEDGAVVVNLTLVDVTGTVEFGAAGAALSQLSAVFAIDSGGPAGNLTLTLVALPEPAAGGLVGLGMVALGGLSAWRRRGEQP